LVQTATGDLAGGEALAVGRAQRGVVEVERVGAAIGVGERDVAGHREGGLGGLLGVGEVVAKRGLAGGGVGPAGDGLGLKRDARDDRIVEDATVEIELAAIGGLRAGGETGEARAAEEFFPVAWFGAALRARSSS
jgi:hypothetical protein